LTYRKDKLKELELKCRASGEESEALRAELERVASDYKKLKVKVVDLEEGVFKRSKAVEDVVKEKEQVGT